MLKRVAALLLILISISLLSSFILSLNFSKTGFEGFIGEGFKSGGQGSVNPPLQSYQSAGYNQTSVLGGKAGGGDGGGGGSGEAGAGMSSFSNLNSPFNPPNVPLFFVEGLDNETNYLRLYTSTAYKDGVWQADELHCSPPSIPLNPKRFKVTPIVNLTDYLPVAKDTKAVVPLREVEIFDCYDSDRGVFSTASVSTPYYGYSSAHSVTPTYFDGTASYNDWEIRALAEKITENATTDYGKVQAIAEYLMKNYVNMPEEYTESKDPVKDFLFVKKEGTCREFASAFVLLSQSIGIPSRIVFGYLADPKPENQTIFASNAYVWAEVKFREGWVEFDVCPRGTAIETETEIEYADPKIVAGENFSVRGSVRDIDGNPVSGFVEVYFKQDKNASEGILVGISPVYGEFNITLKAPDVTGRYNVVAHYTGSSYYAESWSDPEVEVYYRPAFNLTLPDRVAENFLLSGTLETDYTGVVKLCIDRICEDLAVKNGSFEKPVSLSAGNHSITLLFGGDGYLLPAEYTKTVEAGVVEIVVNSTVREGGNLTGRVLFNGKPVNATLLIEGVRVRAIKGNFSAQIPLKLGRNEVNVTVTDFLYAKKVTVFSKREVEIETRTHDDILQVIVRDAEGNPADGFVEYGGVKKQLLNGVAEFKLSDDRVITYLGSEKYLPAVKELGGFSPILLLPPIAALAVIALLYLWFKTRVEDLPIIVEKEHPALPNVWDVGEKIRIHLPEPALIRVDGASEFTDNLELSFDSYGLRRITAEKKDGKIRKRGEIEIRIAPYLEGIAEIAKKLEKNVERAESKTIREILKEKRIRMPVLLRYFEEGRYGGKKYTRREFLEAFQEYLRVIGNEGDLK